jgi:hypothetical protein
MNKNGGNKIRIIDAKASNLDPIKVGALVKIIEGTHKGNEG